MQKRIILLFLSVGILVFSSGCVKEELPPPYTAEQYSADDTMKEQISDTLTEYFNAVAAQDHNAVMRCTTQSFIWNTDETAFYDSCRDVISYSDVTPDYSELYEHSGDFFLPVSYTLTVMDDPESSDGACESILRTESFHFEISDEGCLISGISSVLVG